MKCLNKKTRVCQSQRAALLRGRLLEFHNAGAFIHSISRSETKRLPRTLRKHLTRLDANLAWHTSPPPLNWSNGGGGAREHTKLFFPLDLRPRELLKSPSANEIWPPRLICRTQTQSSSLISKSLDFPLNYHRQVFSSQNGKAKKSSKLIGFGLITLNFKAKRRDCIIFFLFVLAIFMMSTLHFHGTFQRQWKESIF